MITVTVVILLVLMFGFVVAFGAPYVPSLTKEVRSAFTDLYPLGPSDVVVDLGSGDGKVLVEATKHGARAYGYEINPILALVSKLWLRRRATIRMSDMWKVTLPSDTTLVYVFSVTRDSKKLGRFIQKQANEQGRTIRVMTFGAELGEYAPVKQLRGHTLYEITPMSAAMQPETLTV